VVKRLLSLAGLFRRFFVDTAGVCKQLGRKIINTMSDLILIPTELERRFLLPRLSGFAGQRRRGSEDPNWQVELCGFGLVAAAARAAMLIAQRKPRRVLLIGIAGALHDSSSVATATELRAVVVDGIGVGNGASFRPAATMGWDHWQGADTQPSIGDRIALCSARGGVSLSVCAASSDRFQAEHRRCIYPDAAVEEMEGFGVAMACQMAGVHLRMVRGISNIAGDRDFNDWKIEPALMAVADLVEQIMNENWEVA